MFMRIFYKYYHTILLNFIELYALAYTDWDQGRDYDKIMIMIF